MEIDYLALSPELTVAATLVGVLALDLAVPRRLKFLTAVVAIIGVSFAALPLVVMAVRGFDRVLFSGSFVVDDFALVLKGLFLVGAYLVLLMSVSYVEGDRYYQGEYYFLILSSLLGSLVMASARDLIVLFVGLELVTGPLFLLTGWRKGDVKSNESSLKFFIIGVLSTAILLYGMSLLYGLTGSVDFVDLAAAAPSLVREPAFVLATLFCFIGFGFKVSAVPFHFWAPDTYEGAPTPVTAYLSVNSKASGFVGMLVLAYLALPGAAQIWAAAIWVLAALSMTVGNLSALRQTNIVRLLAYSSVAQAGFMLVPFAAAAVGGADLGEAFSATVVYLVIYALMNLGAFAVVIAAVKKTGTTDLEGWSGLGSYDGRLGVLAAIFFLSLAGLPPLAGWFAKFVMFRSVIVAGGVATVVLAVVAAVNAVIAFYYYARVVKAVWLDPAPAVGLGDRRARTSGSLVLAMAIALVVTLVVGVFPQLSAVFGEATRVLVAGS